MTPNDISMMIYVFAYWEHFDQVPTMMQMAQDNGFTRQNAHKAFKRLHTHKILKKFKGKYTINFAHLSQFALDQYELITPTTYTEKYSHDKK